MKKTIALALSALLLTGCAATPAAETTGIPETTAAVIQAEPAAPEYVSRFASAAEILLSDDGIAVNGGGETREVFTSHDIIYYEDKDTYESGNPYGEGEAADKHSAEEAAAHTVVNITAPGAYRISGTLSAGQIRVDLGEDAYEDPTAVVELILSDADITCTVAPAILFLNTYECDGNWSAETAQADVDTTDAGANLILEGDNTIHGAYVAKIFKDNEEEKKLWKQDGAIYSYMSMNVFGPGALELTAENEGLDTELHLTINGGNLHISSDNDGINTNEDGVSVTTINGGNLTIHAGLGAEGDGIDSNGYLVINGGSVVAAANPAADAGLDSDMGSFIHGGTVIAMGSTMDWAESDSRQVTMNLQFASQQPSGSQITITREDGTQIFSFESDSRYARPYSGLILSHPFFQQGETYHVYIDGQQMAYTGTDVGRMPGGMGHRQEGFDPDQVPEDFDPGQMRQDFPLPEGKTFPEAFDPDAFGGRGHRPEGGMQPPEGFDGEMPTLPEGETMPEVGFGRNHGSMTLPGENHTQFYMTDKVNAFSGVMVVTE